MLPAIHRRLLGISSEVRTTCSHGPDPGTLGRAQVVARVFGRVGPAVIRRVLDRVRRPPGAEVLLDCFEHYARAHPSVGCQPH